MKNWRRVFFVSFVLKTVKALLKNYIENWEIKKKHKNYCWNACNIKYTKIYENFWNLRILLCLKIGEMEITEKSMPKNDWIFI